MIKLEPHDPDLASLPAEPDATTDDYGLTTLYRVFGLKAEPFRGANGRVSFNIYGDIQAAQKLIYNNTPVGCVDFLKELKFVRSMLFTAR
jgi:hypothetical protein